MPQAIIWTNADPIHWRIYAALGGYELTSQNIKLSVRCKCQYTDGFIFIQLQDSDLTQLHSHQTHSIMRTQSFQNNVYYKTPNYEYKKPYLTTKR